MEIGYKNRENGEISVFQGKATPKSNFPPHQYEKLYETATVKVIIPID